MGWTWTCFGGKKGRIRQLEADGRLRQRSKERLGNHAPPTPNPHSLAAHIRPKSPARDSPAYEELFQPRQAVCGSSQGSKLFRRKTSRRTSFSGSSSAFENGAKKSYDKSDKESEILVDRLQEEVESLRRRLAEEEAEANKLRNEVCHLRSCGVIQSPERTSCSSFEANSPDKLCREDKAQRHWQSWLGLTLSPASRLKLEDQLRLMAAEEMSRVPGKGLTNGQKALIVASRLWQYQEDPLHSSQIKFEQRDSLSSEDPGRLGRSASQIQGDDVLPEEPLTQPLSKEAPLSDSQFPSTLHVASFREDLKFSQESSPVRVADSKYPPSTSSDSEQFSFRPSTEKPLIKNVEVIQDALTIPELGSGSSECHSIDFLTEQFESCSGQEEVKLESPRRSFSSPTSDQTPDEARRFIDMRYQELEEKLLRSPKRQSISSTPDRSPPRRSSSAAEVDAVDILEEEILHESVLDGNISSSRNSLDAELSLNNEVPISSHIPVIKPFFSCRSGRLWQPLSPVKEVDSGSGRSSGRSSEEQSTIVSTSERDLPDSADGLTMDGWTSDPQSSLRSKLSGSESGVQEESSSGPRHLGVNDGQDDDLFTLSPRRLHHGYNPWDDVLNYSVEDVGTVKVDPIVDCGSVPDWTSSEDSDFDMEPIQCQSPAFSPRQKSSRNKFVQEKDSKVREEYPRDKLFTEMGLHMEEFLSSSDSSMEPDSPSGEKENQTSVDVAPVLNAAPSTIVAHETSSTPKSPTGNQLTLSQDCDHPVLASIENLPKWIEFKGVHVGLSLVKGIQHQVTQDSNIEEMLQAHLDIINKIDALGDRSFLDYDDKVSGGMVYPADTYSTVKVQEHCDLEEGVKPSTIQFSIRGDNERLVHDSENVKNPHNIQELKDILIPHIYSENEKSSRNIQDVKDVLMEHIHPCSSEYQAKEHHQEGTHKRVMNDGVISVSARKTCSEIEEMFRESVMEEILEDCLSLTTQVRDLKELVEDLQSTEELVNEFVPSTRTPEKIVTLMEEAHKDCHSSTKQTSDMEKVEQHFEPLAKQTGYLAPDRTVTEKADQKTGSPGSQDGLLIDTPVSNMEHCMAGAELSVHNQANERSMPILGLALARSHRPSLTSAQVESPRESCSSNDLVRSSHISIKDSAVVNSSSKNIDETAHSCDSSVESSPALLERHQSSLFSGSHVGNSSPESSSPESEEDTNSGSCTQRDLYPVYPARGLLSVTADDRPILGTVATWWMNESLSKSRRWWDGQGIPNSTSKYKEDQRVNWHTTPFETRLEEALATETTTATQSSDEERTHFDGVGQHVESAVQTDSGALRSPS